MHATDQGTSSFVPDIVFSEVKYLDPNLFVSTKPEALSLFQYVIFKLSWKKTTSFLKIDEIDVTKLSIYVP